MVLVRNYWTISGEISNNNYIPMTTHAYCVYFYSKTYAYGYILSNDDIAFTTPTRDGSQFIKNYTNKNDYLVYTSYF